MYWHILCWHYLDQTVCNCCNSCWHNWGYSQTDVKVNDFPIWVKYNFCKKLFIKNYAYGIFLCFLIRFWPKLFQFLFFQNDFRFFLVCYYNTRVQVDLNLFLILVYLAWCFYFNNFLISNFITFFTFILYYKVYMMEENISHFMFFSFFLLQLELFLWKF